MLRFLKNYFLPDTAKPAAVLKPVSRPEMSAASASELIKASDPLERKAAIAAITDLSLLADRATNDGDKQVKAAARARLKSQLLDHGKPLAERERALGVLDADLLEAIAMQSNEVALRRAALSRITRMGFLGDRAVADPDAAIRMEIVQRIDAQPTLQRLLQQSRTKDKAVYRAVKEKLEASREASGDVSLFQERGEQICAELDQLIRAQPDGLPGKLQAIQGRWDALQARVTPALVNRFVSAKNSLDRIINPPAKPVPVASDSNAEPAAVVIRQGLDLELADIARRLSEQQQHATRDQLEHFQKQWQSRMQSLDASADDIAAGLQFNQFLQDARARIRAAEQANDELLNAHRQQLKELGKLIEAGDIKAAKILEAELGKPTNELKRLLLPADKQLAGELRGKLGKLLAWERWGSNKQRTTLCDEIEALHGSGMHPDAMATKIKDAQAAWRELDKLEGLSEEQAKALGIGKRFRALCFRALEPAKGYFDKRRELRGQKKEALEEVLARIDSVLSSDSRTTKDLLDAKADLQERLNSLDDLEPATRGQLGKRMRDQREQLNAALDAQFAEAEAQKRKLIAALRRDLIGADAIGASNAAKTAQANWKTLPRAGRKVEDALWAELRELVDPVFAKQKASFDAERATQQERDNIGDALIEEVRALIEQVQADHSVSADLERIENRWRAYINEGQPAEVDPRKAERDGYEARPRKNDPKLEAKKQQDRHKERAFDQAVSAVQAAIQARGRQELKAVHELQTLKAALCLQVENAWLGQQDFDLENAQASWQSMTHSNAADDKALRARFERAVLGLQSQALPDEATLAEHAATGAALAMAHEYLSGKASPEHLKAERMQYQVRRLSEKLNTGAQSASEELAQIRTQWLSLGPLASADRAALGERLGEAI